MIVVTKFTWDDNNPMNPPSEHFVGVCTNYEALRGELFAQGINLDDFTFYYDPNDDETPIAGTYQMGNVSINFDDIMPNVLTDLTS